MSCKEVTSPTILAGCPNCRGVIELNHNRAYYRHHRERVIHRKVNMLRAYGGRKNVDAWTHGHPGRLSKGKIHCSCFMCRRKSFDRPKHRDVKQHLDARQQKKQTTKEGYLNQEESQEVHVALPVIRFSIVMFFCPSAAVVLISISFHEGFGNIKTEYRTLMYTCFASSIR